MIVRWVVVLLLFSIFISSSSVSLDDYEISCNGAKSTNYQTTETCSFVSWTTANLYLKSGFSQYTTTQALLTGDQDKLAQSIRDSYLESFKVPAHQYSNCRNSLNRFVCVETFPYCPIVGSSFSTASYLPPCRLLCEQVNTHCGSKLSCDSYPTHSCTMTIPDGHYLLSIDKVSLNTLPTFYIVMLSLWTTFAFFYTLCAKIVFRTVSLGICQVFIGAMLLKVLVMIISQMFWSDCALNGGVCVDLTSGGLGITYHVYETGLFVFFLVIAKGYSITRENLLLAEWRGIISLCTIFYTVTIVTFKSIDPTHNIIAWVGFLIIVYGCMYYFVLAFADVEMKHLYSQVKRLTTFMPPIATQQIHYKYNIYRVFLACIFIFIVIEITCHVMYTMHYDLYMTVLVYEVTQLILLFTLGILLWPRPLSPFFYMMSTSMNREYVRFSDNEISQAERTLSMVPIVEIADLDLIETQPLMADSSKPAESKDSVHDGDVDAANEGKSVEMTNLPTTRRISILGSKGNGISSGAAASTLPPTFLGEDEIELTSLFNNNINRNISTIVNRAAVGPNNNNREGNNHTAILSTFYNYEEIPTQNMSANALRSNLAFHNATTVRSTDQVKMVAVSTPDRNIVLGAFKSSTSTDVRPPVYLGAPHL